VEPEPAPAPPSPPAEPADAKQSAAALRLAALLREEGERPRTDHQLAESAGLQGADARRAWREAERTGLAVRVGENLHFDPVALDRVSAQVLEICRREGGGTIAQVRDELGTGRRFAQALLEHLDAEKVTVRQGDRHVLRERRR
jgi:selenocysteine-specific elongation factor